MRIFKGHSLIVKIVALNVALLAVGYMFFLSPKLGALRGLKGDLKQLEGELKKLREMEKKVSLPGLEEERSWQAMKEKVGRMSAGSDLPKLMQELTKQAAANRISGASFSVFRSPPPSASKGTKAQMDEFFIKISFHSQYQDLALFLKALDDLSQWVAVESLEVRKASTLISTALQVRPVSLSSKK
ncbi:MAG: type 4a pilus biogenesis protein PilO [Proteobacteria bacterium]|nr:type 4a pilus biogenesis protein PilO [Pseudomonadota bacterium]